ncbi:hypothetical protein GCM10020331_057470 [Ectobacillus funiculus]
MILGITIGSISQLVGINSIMYYGTQILENSGFGTKKTALIANVANGLIAVVAVIVGISLLHKVNRRPMLLTGLIGVTVALITIGISASVLEGSPMLPYVVLAMTVIYLAFFSKERLVLWYGSYLLKSSQFVYVGSVWEWLFLFFYGSATFFSRIILPSSFRRNRTFSNIFFLFAIFGIAGIIYVAKALPETRGLSLEQIEANFRK